MWPREDDWDPYQPKGLTIQLPLGLTNRVVLPFPEADDVSIFEVDERGMFPPEAEGRAYPVHLPRVVVSDELVGHVKEPEDPSPASDTAKVKRCLRLRKRGRLTSALERSWKNLPCWWSDLAGQGTLSGARSWLASFMDGAVDKISDGKEIIVKGAEECGVRTLQLLQIPFESNGHNRPLWICPELLATLVSVRMFRPVSEGLLASLRSRSRLWARDEGVDVMDLVRFLPGTLVLAMLPMPDEVTAIGALRGAAGRWSVSVLGALAKGRLVSAPEKPLGNFLRRPFSWLFSREDSRVLGPGVRELQLPA